MFSLWCKARRENSAASQLLGSTSLRFALQWLAADAEFFLERSFDMANGRQGKCRTHAFLPG
ncbi:hypothetical protein [Thiolapillus sp.]|uniref:hypothetical protein n=1 Tax=Thiolapillus sp. TaxID=2017437 RepID=UPI003AF8D97C